MERTAARNFTSAGTFGYFFDAAHSKYISSYIQSICLLPSSIEPYWVGQQPVSSSFDRREFVSTPLPVSHHDPVMSTRLKIALH